MYRRSIVELNTNNLDKYNVKRTKNTHRYTNETYLLQFLIFFKNIPADCRDVVKTPRTTHNTVVVAHIMVLIDIDI